MSINIDRYQNTLQHRIECCISVLQYGTTCVREGVWMRKGGLMPGVAPFVTALATGAGGVRGGKLKPEYAECKSRPGASSSTQSNERRSILMCTQAVLGWLAPEVATAAKSKRQERERKHKRTECRHTTRRIVRLRAGRHLLSEPDHRPANKETPPCAVTQGHAPRRICFFADKIEHVGIFVFLLGSS